MTPPSSARLNRGPESLAAAVEQQAIVQRNIPMFREAAQECTYVNKFLGDDEMLPFVNEFDIQVEKPIWVHINQSWRIHPRFDKPIVSSEFVAFISEAIQLCEEDPVSYVGDLENIRQAVIKKRDFAFQVASGSENEPSYRFRGHIERDAHGMGVKIRVLKNHVGSLHELGFPDGLERRILNKTSGLVVVAGGLGQGKSTTLAALVRHYVRIYPDRLLLSLEDPIEYLFDDEPRLRAHQKRVGKDVASWSEGIECLKRESANAILLGELRDEASVRTALDAAGSGVLVLTTCHADAIPRVFDFFVEKCSHVPIEVLRKKLSHVTRAVVVQKLVPSIRNKSGYNQPELVYEFAINDDENSAMTSAIRTGKWDEINLKGHSGGAWEDRVDELYQKRLIDAETKSESLRR